MGPLQLQPCDFCQSCKNNSMEGQFLKQIMLELVIQKHPPPQKKTST